MTETTRLITVQELLTEQRYIEADIDSIQRSIPIITDEEFRIGAETLLEKKQNRLKQIQEELIKCKKNAQ